MIDGMERRMLRTGLILILCLVPALGAAAGNEITYEGKALARTIHVDKLKALFRLVDEPAARRAETATGLSLDRNRLRLVLEDVPVGLSFYQTAMATEPGDTLTVRIRAQVWLRSAAYDSVAAHRVLTHEYVHAIMLQNLPAEDFDRLPRWFNEGMAVHISGETEDRLRVALAQDIGNALHIFDGLADGPAADDYLAGSWWFRALETLRGPEAIRTLTKALVEKKHLYGALQAIDCTIEDLWREAERDGSETVMDICSSHLAPLLICELSRAVDSEQGLAQYRSFLEAHEDDWLGEYALYGAAELAYELQYIPEARDYLDRLAQARYDFGNGDRIMLLRILVEMDCGRKKRARRLCEDYFGLWPDGRFFEPVQQIYRIL